MVACPLNPITPSKSNVPTAVTEATLGGPSTSTTTGLTGVTATIFEYAVNALALSFSLALTHLLLLLGEETIEGLDLSVFTTAYPVAGAVADEDSTSSIDIKLNTLDVCAAYDTVYPFEIADALITGTVSGLTYTAFVKAIGADLLPYTSRKEELI